MRPNLFGNLYKIGMDKPYVYTRASNRFTCDSDSIWNCAAPRWYEDHVNPTQFTGKWSQNGPDLKGTNHSSLM